MYEFDWTGSEQGQWQVFLISVNDSCSLSKEGVIVLVLHLSENGETYDLHYQEIIVILFLIKFVFSVNISLRDSVDCV
jgi:hypothetical protein